MVFIFDRIYNIHGISVERMEIAGRKDRPDMEGRGRRRVPSAALDEHLRCDDSVVFGSRVGGGIGELEEAGGCLGGDAELVPVR